MENPPPLPEPEEPDELPELEPPEEPLPKKPPERLLEPWWRLLLERALLLGLGATLMNSRLVSTSLTTWESDIAPCMNLTSTPSRSTFR